MASQGFYDGTIVVDKFGENPAIATTTDPEDLWEFGGEYNYTANAGATHYVSSSSAADTQLISFGTITADSDGNWNLETFTQNVAGQVKTELLPPSGDNIVRVWRMANEGDAGEDLAGTLYCYEDDTVTDGKPDTDSKVRAVIDNGNNQTLMLLYTIPTGYVGFLYRGEVGIKFDAGPS